MTTLDPKGLPGEAARLRKTEILRLAQDAVEHRGERRRARRHAVAMIALTAGVTLLAVVLLPTRLAGPPMATPGQIAGSGASGTIGDTGNAPTALVTRVATTSGLARTLASESSGVRVARGATPPEATPVAVTRVATSSSVQRIGDRRALDLLDQAGTPAGLVRVGGETRLVYHNPPASPPAPGSDATRDSDGQAISGLLARAATYRPG